MNLLTVHPELVEGSSSPISTRQTPSVRDMGNAARDSIKKAAGGLLDGFFKKPKPTAPATTPPSAPATPDTTQR